jgi:N-acetylglucosamine-6-sulfatase
MNETATESGDNYYRQRILALQSVDDLVDNIFSWLDKHPELADNTYIMYTSDNGFHIGQHRLPPGKTCNIEEDINVPFFIRGPGIGKGKVYKKPTSHTDIVPTLLSLANIEPPLDFDGEVMPLFGSDGRSKSEHVNVEYWGYGGLEGVFGSVGKGVIPDPTTYTGGSGMLYSQFGASEIHSLTFHDSPRSQ